MFTLTDLRRKKYIIKIITCYPSIHTLKLPKYIVRIKPKEKIQRANGAMNTHMHARMTPTSGWADGLGLVNVADPNRP